MLRRLRVSSDDISEPRADFVADAFEFFLDPNACVAVSEQKPVNNQIQILFLDFVAKTIL